VRGWLSPRLAGGCCGGSAVRCQGQQPHQRHVKQHRAVHAPAGPARRVAQRKHLAPHNVQRAQARRPHGLKQPRHYSQQDAGGHALDVVVVHALPIGKGQPLGLRGGRGARAGVRARAVAARGRGGRPLAPRT
jgi:hypothetical protein